MGSSPAPQASCLIRHCACTTHWFSSTCYCGFQPNFYPQCKVESSCTKSVLDSTIKHINFPIVWISWRTRTCVCYYGPPVFIFTSTFMLLKTFLLTLQPSLAGLPSLTSFHFLCFSLLLTLSHLTFSLPHSPFLSSVWLSFSLTPSLSLSLPSSLSLYLSLYLSPHCLYFLLTTTDRSQMTSGWSLDLLLVSSQSGLFPGHCHILLALGAQLFFFCDC